MKTLVRRYFHEQQSLSEIISDVLQQSSKEMSPMFDAAMKIFRENLKYYCSLRCLIDSHHKDPRASALVMNKLCQFVKRQQKFPQIP